MGTRTKAVVHLPSLRSTGTRAARARSYGVLVDMQHRKFRLATAIAVLAIAPVGAFAQDSLDIAAAGDFNLQTNAAVLALIADSAASESSASTSLLQNVFGNALNGGAAD